MKLDLTDKETFALLNLLVDTIEGDRYPMSPRIRLLRQIVINQVRRGGRAASGTRAEAPPLYAAATRSPANTGRARSWAGATPGSTAKVEQRLRGAGR